MWARIGGQVQRYPSLYHLCNKLLIILSLKLQFEYSKPANDPDINVGGEKLRHAGKSKEENKRELCEDRRKDHEIFISFVMKYGPLDGSLYSTSMYPGKVYYRLLHFSAMKIQRWYKPRASKARVRRAHLLSILLYFGQEGYVQSSIRVVSKFRAHEKAAIAYRHKKVTRWLKVIMAYVSYC